LHCLSWRVSTSPCFPTSHLLRTFEANIAAFICIKFNLSIRQTKKICSHVWRDECSSKLCWFNLNKSSQNYHFFILASSIVWTCHIFISCSLKLIIHVTLQYYISCRLIKEAVQLT
jgi:hypothetical protein